MSTESPFELVCCAAMHDSLLYHHLMPLAMNPRVDRILVVRHRPCEFGEIPKTEFVLVPDRPRPLRWLRMLQHCIRLARRPSVRAIVSFNPFPYGLLATPAARLTNKPIHYALIGCDLNVHLQSFVGKFVLPQLRRASLVTVPGPTFKTQAVAADIPADRIHTIRHVVDLEHFVPAATALHTPSLIAVGDLLPLKRFDTLINALPRVVATCPDTRLTFLGDGPERGRLEALAQTLGVSRSVEFAGRVADIRPYLQRASVFVCTSEREGFPRALSEAIASGLVPVTTPVGTIPDYLENGTNGLLFPVNDADALADAVTSLFADSEYFMSIRGNVLQLRDSFGYDSATSVWDQWLSSLAEPAGVTPVVTPVP